MTDFVEGRFSTFDRDLKNTKIMVPMNPEGVHGQPPGLPDYRRHGIRWGPVPPSKGRSTPYFSAHMSILDKRVDGSRCHLVRR